MTFLTRLIAVSLLLAIPLGHTIAQTHGSQIQIARNATLVVIGEVVYIGKPLPKLDTAAHINYQVVVFRLKEVMKGEFSAKFIKVNFGFGFDSNGISEKVFETGRRFILLLERKESAKARIDLRESSRFMTYEADVDFIEYLEYPCYFSWTDAAIRADVQEVDAVKWFITTTTQGKH